MYLSRVSYTLEQIKPRRLQHEMDLELDDNVKRQLKLGALNASLEVSNVIEAKKSNKLQFSI